MPLFSILIVDDEAENIKLLGSLLKENGYEAEFAMDGEKALTWLMSKPFDLVLLDVMMPGMNGYDVCRTIKSHLSLKHIPVLFLTAKTETEDIVMGFEVGGSDYITKPFKPPELLARVKMHVEMKILRGLIPICASCKDIRDDKGKWTRMEAYFQSHSLAQFSHGLCPKCSDRLYGHEDWYKKK
ncbi:MAG: response regulator [Proteobacteria bacterium]|nr:response regulator [Pseudomonadota bacterium]